MNDDVSTPHKQDSADPQGEQERALTAFSSDPELAPGYHVVLPSDFLRSTAFTPTAKVLYALLLHYANLGAQYWPGETKLAEECAASEGLVQEAMRSLLAAGLMSHQQASGKRKAVYAVHSFYRIPGVPQGRGAISHLISEGNIHIPQEQHPTNKKQIQQDAQQLIAKVGISKASAISLAQLAWERGCSEGYVAEVVEYATTTPGIKNPAGCVVELIRRNESRKPSNSFSHQDGAQALDAEKYTTGKYAFLFRRYADQENTVDDTADEEGSDGPDRQDRQSGEQHSLETQEGTGKREEDGKGQEL